MIAFACPYCKERYKVRPEFAGHEAACLRCGNPIEVPRPTKPDVLEVSDNLLPSDHGGKPAAEEEMLDVLPVEDEGAQLDAAWGEDHRPRNDPPPKQEVILDVLPAPAEYLEEVTDEPRREKMKLPAIYGTAATVKLRGSEVVIYHRGGSHDDRCMVRIRPGTYRIHVFAVSEVVVEAPDVLDRGVIRFLIGHKRQGRRYAVKDEMAVVFAGNQYAAALDFKRLVESLRKYLADEYKMRNG